MAPPKKSRRGRHNDNDDDDSIPDNTSKFAKLLAMQKDDSDDDLTAGDPQKVFGRLEQKEQVQFDFKKADKLYKLMQQQQKEPEQPKPIPLTEEQKAEIKRFQQLKKQHQQQKSQVKKEKNAEKLKTEEEEKEKEQEELRKQEEQRKIIEEELLKHRKEQNKSACSVAVVLLVLLAGMAVMQYYNEIYAATSAFRGNKQEQIDYYAVLEASPDATNAELKNKYRKMMIKYHPDANPGCEDCEQRIRSILSAWEVLGQANRREEYDSIFGDIPPIRSVTITLTPLNYPHMVYTSSKPWLVQVYDSTQPACHNFSPFWEQMNSVHSPFLSLGRVDVWRQTDMLAYLPFKFRIYPAIYYYYKGKVDICSWTGGSPVDKMAACVNEMLDQYVFVDKISAGSYETLVKDNKHALILSSDIQMSLNLKLILLKYSPYFDYYMSSGTRGRTITFKINALSPQNSVTFVLPCKSLSTPNLQYISHLLSLYTIRELTVCELLSQCEERKCTVVQNKDMGRLGGIPQPNGETDQQPKQSAHSIYNPPSFESYMKESRQSVSNKDLLAELLSEHPLTNRMSTVIIHETEKRQFMEQVKRAVAAAGSRTKSRRGDRRSRRGGRTSASQAEEVDISEVSDEDDSSNQDSSEGSKSATKIEVPKELTIMQNQLMIPGRRPISLSLRCTYQGWLSYGYEQIIKLVGEQQMREAWLLARDWLDMAGLNSYLGIGGGGYQAVDDQ